MSHKKIMLILSSTLCSITLVHATPRLDICDNVVGRWTGLWSEKFKFQDCLYDVSALGSKRGNIVRFAITLKSANYPALCKKNAEKLFIGICGDNGELWFAEEKFKGKLTGEKYLSLESVTNIPAQSSDTLTYTYASLTKS